MVKAGKYGGSLTVKPKSKLLVFLRGKEPGRTQKTVEDGSGLPSLRLSMYERGVPIPIDHLERLALYYGMPARELVEPSSLEATLRLMSRLYKLFELTEVELLSIESEEVEVVAS